MTATNTNQPRTAQPFGDRMTTRPIIRTIALWTAILLGCALFVLAAPPHPADADTHTTTIEFTGEDFYIPRPASASDQVGVERLLASVDVPAELQGLTCSVAGTSANGESVHPNNYGMLRSNGDSVRIDGTEDEANGVRLSDRQIVLGTTVQLFNVMLPDADDRVATSVNYSVRVTCQTTPDDTTTTTTTPSTTSTTSGSTSTSTTTSTTLPTTTTSAPPATTTTAPTDSTTTTVPPSTSTTGPGSSTSTTAPTDSTSSSLIEQDTSTTRPTLPFTGPPVEAAGIAMAAVAALLLGGAVLLAGKEA